MAFGTGSSAPILYRPLILSVSEGSAFASHGVPLSAKAGAFAYGCRANTLNQPCIRQLILDVRVIDWSGNEAGNTECHFQEDHGD